MSLAGPRVALTFDDGPGPSTERLLDVLAKHAATATFFLLGKNLCGEALGQDAERAQTIAVRAAREGHLLGNHTVSHERELTASALIEEIEVCDRLVRLCRERAGCDPATPIPIRLPFGPFQVGGAARLEALERLGRPHCHWSADPLDWRPGRTAAEIATTMMRQIDRAWQNGATPVVLLHDAGQGRVGHEDSVGVLRDATVAAVDEVCTRLRDRRPHYVTLLETPAPVVSLRSESSAFRAEHRTRAAYRANDPDVLVTKAGE